MPSVPQLPQAPQTPHPAHRPASRPQRAQLARLAGLTLLVLLVHALLLGGMPSALGLFEPGEAPRGESISHFVTRSLPTAAPALAPTPATPVAPAPAPAAPKPAPPSTDLPVAAPPAPHSPSGLGAAAPATSTTEAIPASTANAGGVASLPGSLPDPPSAGVATGHQPAASVATSPLPTLPALSQPPAPPAPADAQTAISRVVVPSGVRLLFDGRGEERGFIKYTGSGEILWEPEGAQYKAKLEISTWGVRVRTWTSKGTLGPAGLEPLRFGDKPRGAELATHFQRDKNIISFSANNPDVPLQLGAQDKLSALLQLSAIVAGAPAQFGAGSTIRFQAADAHRAEPWHFKVGALETIELPGGALQGLKLSKAPTLEFDQAIEVWLAPSLQYLPVRLRITEANGDFVDLLWRKTQKPDGS